MILHIFSWKKKFKTKTNTQDFPLLSLVKIERWNDFLKFNFIILSIQEKAVFPRTTLSLSQNGVREHARERERECNAQSRSLNIG